MTALAEIRDLQAGAAYPGWLLEGCETALVLYAAGFLGKQDCVWIAEAGLTGTCVDTDAELLATMTTLYPDGWEYVAADVFEFAEQTDRGWDIVSLDPWTRDFQKCADNLETWCALARRGVVLGSGPRTSVSPPDGWRVTERRRRSDYDGGVYWDVMEPA